MKSTRLIALFLAVAATALYAQDNPNSEDIVELSPFAIGGESESSYMSGNLSRTRVFNADTSTTPAVPITIVKRAEAVAIQFVLRNDQEKPEVRNKELFDTVTGLEAGAKQAGLVIEQREVRFTGGERKILSFSKGPSTSYVNLVVVAKLEPGVRVADVVKKVRDLVGSKQMSGKTRVADGTVGLVIKNLGQYRTEILPRIFEDLETVKKGLGADFEVRPSGLNKPVLARPVGEGELELWIDYSFTIHSVREMTNAKK